MRCLEDPKEFGIHGNYLTASASNLLVAFEKCDRLKRKCKSEKEIAEWMEFKYIITLENDSKFI
jgi:hypothetical protein